MLDAIGLVCFLLGLIGLFSPLIPPILAVPLLAVGTFVAMLNDEVAFMFLVIFGAVLLGGVLALKRRVTSLFQRRDDDA